MEAGQASHRQWLQEELRKLPTSEMQSISAWLQQVLQARLQLEEIERQPAKAEASATPARPSAEPREKEGAGVAIGAPVEGAKPEAAVQKDKHPNEPSKSKPVEETAKQETKGEATKPMEVDPSARAKEGSMKQSETSSVKKDEPPASAPVPVATPAANGTSTQTARGPKRGSRSRSRSPKVQATQGRSDVPSRQPAKSAPPAQPAPAAPAPAAAPQSVLAQPAEKAEKAPPSEGPVISIELDQEHTELRSSLWSAFSAANDVKSRVSQVEQNFNTLQAQSQQATLKAEESFTAVQHWCGMVEQCRMEHAALQTPFYEPHFQLQAQQRLATAMQSHSFAVQSSERAQLHKKTAEAAVKDAAEALATSQEELRESGLELQEVVRTAEEFLKVNADRLPQEKAQPLAALCSRFSQFAQQLGVMQDEAPKAKPVQEHVYTQGLAPTQPKPISGGFQQRVMIVEEEHKPDQEEQPMDLFGEEDHDLQSFSGPFCPFFESGSCQDGDECQFSHERPAGLEASPEAAAEKKQEELAAYKNRLLSEASYLQAVFGGKKEEA